MDPLLTTHKTFHARHYEGAPLILLVAMLVFGSTWFLACGLGERGKWWFPLIPLSVAITLTVPILLPELPHLRLVTFAPTWLAIEAVWLAIIGPYRSHFERSTSQLRATLFLFPVIVAALLLPLSISEVRGVVDALAEYQYLKTLIYADTGWFILFWWLGPAREVHTASRSKSARPTRKQTISSTLPGGVFRMLQSTFISYGGPDTNFAQRLNDALLKNGVTTFFFAKDAIPGRKLHRLMREGVNQHDRVILVCSKASLDRPGVLNEITETLQREARDGGKEYLIPITLDDYVFMGWKPDDPGVAQAIKDRVVADFKGAETDPAKFNEGLLRLIATLKK